MSDTEKPKQKQMDDTLEDSFPASDPPSWSTPHAEKDLKAKKDESKGRPDEVHQNFSKEDFIADKSSSKKADH